MPPNPTRLLEEAAKAKREGRTEDFQVLMQTYDETVQARATAEQEARSTAMGGPFVSPEGQAVGITDAGPLPLAALTVGAGALGWVIARRTLLAARPKLTRKWFGMFGPAMWRCGRCGTDVALRAHRCEVCGQEQTWPKWSVPPMF